MIYLHQTPVSWLLYTSTTFHFLLSFNSILINRIILFAYFSSVTAAGWKNGDLGLEMTLLRYSIRSTWWLFTREYIHYVDLEVWETYKGNIKYQSKDFNSHCHEDGIWCVNHGDPKSPEVTIWYKGLTYQHNTVSEDCWLGDQDTCQQYNDIVEHSRA